MPDALALSPYVVALIFFGIAFVYSSVGLGGGSSYTALMAILGFSTLAIPMVSLSLNLMVTAIGSFNFVRNRHARLWLILPFLLGSMPLAYIGGALQLPRTVFYWILLLSLCLVAFRIYYWRDTRFNIQIDEGARIAVSLLAGAVLGFVAGTVGIGGGIYLIPIIILLGLGSQKEAAACGVIFVFVNSLVGLASRLQHNSIDLVPYLPIVLAVLIGGTLGSYLGSFRYSARTMEKILGAIVVVAILALVRKVASF